tara:strand:+ start:1243 stop:1452 length:210 start_codon:yes stop_codon:yes gene_type:complete
MEEEVKEEEPGVTPGGPDQEDGSDLEAVDDEVIENGENDVQNDDEPVEELDNGNDEVEVEEESDNADAE